MDKYTARIFVRRKILEDMPRGYQNAGLIQVTENSLARAIESINQESHKKFPEPEYIVHVDHVTKAEKVVYQTAWDEEGNPIASFIDN